MNVWRLIWITCGTLIALWIATLFWDASRAAEINPVAMPKHASFVATFPTKYDHTIKKASERWLPGIPWKLLKAQLYQESRLDPAAQSQVGAEGLGQFMPATWKEVSSALGYGNVGRSVADPSIEGAAYYMSLMKKLYPAVNELDKHRMGAASYNAGGGNILKAKRLCGNADEWDAIAPCLQKVTGRHSAETITYIERIWHWWEMMESGR